MGAEILLEYFSNFNLFAHCSFSERRGLIHLLFFDNILFLALIDKAVILTDMVTAAAPTTNMFVLNHKLIDCSTINTISPFHPSLCLAVNIIITIFACIAKIP